MKARKGSHLLRGVECHSPIYRSEGQTGVMTKQANREGAVVSSPGERGQNHMALSTSPPALRYDDSGEGGGGCSLLPVCVAMLALWLTSPT